MSFLLDQLKKSGKKRQIELAILEQMKKSELKPETQAEPEHLRVPEISSSGFKIQQKFLYLFLGICVISAGMFIWWKYSVLPERQDNALQTASLGSHNQTAVGVIDATNTSQEPATEKRPEKTDVKAIAVKRTEKRLTNVTTALEEEPDKANLIDKKESKAFSDTSDEKTYSRAISKANNETQKLQGVVDITELPQSVKSSLPEIKISSHLYRKDSSLVSINGRIMTGAYNITEELYLEEITPEGVILSYRNHRFSIKTK